MLDTAENTPEIKTDNVPPDVDTDENALNEGQKGSPDGELPPTERDHKPDDDSEQAFYFGDDELGSPSSEEDTEQGLVKHLRNTIKEKDKELKAFRRQQIQQPGYQQPITPAPRMPQLSDAGIDYDEDIYTAKVNEWAESNSKYLNQKAEQARQQLSLQQAHQQKLTHYQQRVKHLKIPHYQQAEQVVIDEVPEAIQAMIIHWAEKPEMVVLALGRNAELRQQMANATDPVAIGRLIGSIESKARIMPKPKTAAPTPEIQGGHGAVLNNLEKLREKARETGDYTEYHAARRKANKK